MERIGLHGRETQASAMSVRRRAGLLAAVVGFVLALPGDAGAAYPGANGDLAYHVPPCNPGAAEFPGDPGCPSVEPGPVLYRVRGDGTQLRRIFARNVPKGQYQTVVPWDGSDPVWSPGGRRIAFLRPTVPSREGCEVTDVLCEWWVNELVVGDVASGAVRTVLSPRDPRFGAAEGGGPPSLCGAGRPGHRTAAVWCSGIRTTLSPPR